MRNLIKIIKHVWLRKRLHSMELAISRNTKRRRKIKERGMKLTKRYEIALEETKEYLRKNPV